MADDRHQQKEELKMDERLILDTHKKGKLKLQELWCNLKLFKRIFVTIIKSSYT